EPSSGVLRYNMGCAKVSLGKEALEAGDQDAAFEHFEAALEIFDNLPDDADIELREDAAYNRVNTEGQQARAIARAAPHEEALEAVKDSISNYEEFLAQYPDHEAARHNLDHMRYLRKTLVEDPPQEEPEPEEDDSDSEEPEEEEGEGEGEAPEPEDGDEEGEGEGGEEEEEHQPEAGDGEQEQDPEEREAPAEPQPNPEETESPEPPETTQTMEAILEALEEEDNREQREMLREHNGPRIRAQWW
ncbi:MAG: hypothetical protein R6W89_07045, partial [Candidatus Hydrogenedentota bacterium]